MPHIPRGGGHPVYEEVFWVSGHHPRWWNGAGRFWALGMKVPGTAILQPEAASCAVLSELSQLPLLVSGCDRVSGGGLVKRFRAFAALFFSTGFSCNAYRPLRLEFPSAPLAFSRLWSENCNLTLPLLLLQLEPGGPREHVREGWVCTSVALFCPLFRSAAQLQAPPFPPILHPPVTELSRKVYWPLSGHSAASAPLAPFRLLSGGCNLMLHCCSWCRREHGTESVSISVLPHFLPPLFALTHPPSDVSLH